MAVESGWIGPKISPTKAPAGPGALGLKGHHGLSLDFTSSRYLFWEGDPDIEPRRWGGRRTIGIYYLVLLQGERFDGRFLL